MQYIGSSYPCIDRCNRSIASIDAVNWCIASIDVLHQLMKYIDLLHQSMQYIDVLHQLIIDLLHRSMHRSITLINAIDQCIASIDAIDLLHRSMHRSRYNKSVAIDLLHPIDLLIDIIHQSIASINT